MKYFFLAISFLTLPFCIFADSQINQGKYEKELQNFIYSADYKMLFDEDDALGVRSLAEKIENYSQLSYLQRLFYSMFLQLGVVIATPKTFPDLYSYVKQLCKKNYIAVPTIFVTLKNNFYNAAASKLLMSSGVIVVGKRLLLELSDEEIEGVVAHEIGHIYHNHINKAMGLKWVNFAAISLTACLYLASRNLGPGNDPSPEGLVVSLLWLSGITLVPGLINKSYENEADRFAFKEGHAKGISDFLTRLNEKDEQQDRYFIQLSERMEKKAKNISFSDFYLDLVPHYYGSRFVHLCAKAFRWICWNTPLGTHPSNDCRIKAAQRYLAHHS